jgi:alpha-glucoside transport system permease protein
MLQILNTALTVVLGIAAALALYWVLNKIAELLPGRAEYKVKPYLFILPALLAILLYLVYPAIITVFNSFKGQVGFPKEKWVGFENYTKLFSNDDFRQSLINTVLWMIIVPAASIAIGLAVAVLVDRLKPKAEKTAKTIIFLPMAISAVAASTVWKFVYSYQTPGQEQIGLLNAVWTSFGADPVHWLGTNEFRLNSILLMVMMLWAQIGFSMVLLSSAVKAVPTETLEAARIDGASEPQIFFRVVIPQIWPTIVTVFITVLIGVMKVFDIIYVMTGGNHDTSVIGMQFFDRFVDVNYGAASAIVVILMIAIIPVMVFQVRQFRREEANR